MKNILFSGFILGILTSVSDALFMRTESYLEAARESLPNGDIDYDSEDALYSKTVPSKAAPKTSPISQKIKNRINHYTADVKVGTPGQKISLLADTGSSDTWMNWIDSSYCQRSENNCAKYGTFDFDASTSKQFVRDEQQNVLKFFVSYQDNAYAEGKFIKDKFVIGDQSVESVRFGLATQTSDKVPVMGLGLPSNEAVVLLEQGGEYPNLVPTLFNDGLIKTTAFSLWLNDLESDSGIILFGGIDTAKFSGDLVSFSIQKSTRYDEYAITLNNIVLSNSPIEGKLSAPAVLDSGTTNCFLPSAFTYSFWEILNAVPDSNGVPYVQCELAKSSLTLNFTFGSKTIKVPISQLIYRNPDAKPLISDSGTALCTLGLQSSEDRIVLGLTFLRSAYVVHDIKRREVSIAQAKYTTKSSIQEFGPEGIPGLYKSGISNVKMVDEDDNLPQESFIKQNSPEISMSASSIGSEQNDVSSGILNQR